MSSQMDNCCGCAGGLLHAAVEATFRWPGFAPFTTTGPGTDTLGVRYRTITVTAQNQLGAAVTKSISSDPYNATFTDTLTGTDATGDGPWLTYGLLSPWPSTPPTTVTETLVSWPDGVFELQLSDAIDAAWCKARCQDILDSIDLATLIPGTDSIAASYDLPLGSPANAWQSHTTDWLCFGVFPGPETPPGSGNFPPYYAWGGASTGALYTVNGVFFPATFTPFDFVTPSIYSGPNGLDVPPTPGSANSFSQENYWKMRKSLSQTIGAPVCCEDDYYNYGTPPAPVCQMIPDDGHGHLILPPPALPFYIADNQELIVRTPWFGKALTGGGCPCA